MNLHIQEVYNKQNRVQSEYKQNVCYEQVDS